MRFGLTTKGIIFCLGIVSLFYVGILLYEVTTRAQGTNDGEGVEEVEEKEGENTDTEAEAARTEI